MIICKFICTSFYMMRTVHAWCPLKGHIYLNKLQLKAACLFKDACNLQCTNYLTVFDHFVGLAIKGLKKSLLTLIIRLDEISIIKKQRQKQPPEVLCKKSVLKNFTNFTGKHLYLSFFNRFAGLRPATLLKRDSNTGVFQ